MKYTKCVPYINPFYASHFLNLRNSANHEKVDRLSAKGEILIGGIVSLVYNLFSIDVEIIKISNS